ncbi:DUF1761 domain-containing protein [Hyunsoonleella pacifica]|uniref:DUF1761 domain-containing protein n=1 Tax=Hyunsoonleella pacifica TaxID=1080224 RepID=A0A4Q9FSJ9_9FLAO|nr:DUF1761 domain-containing protein [Hyunsoonleella pacifica]TBN16697.1 DUF1761 domain-containing protein [Hyunsoonleella pacifica]GGD17236.1 hypothetical protein GCM10011368_18980 [Hyunsoonleella pacifica]
MEFNFIAILVAALVPMILGFLWYGPMLFQNAWMKASGMTEEKIQSGNMPVIFGVSLLLAIILAFFTQFLVIHEMGVYGMTEGQLEGETVQAFLAEWAGKYRSFGHGAIHGAMAGLMFVFPLLAIINLFERKPFKLTLINAGYWVVVLAIMGSIISGWV